MILDINMMRNDLLNQMLCMLKLSIVYNKINIQVF